jgi:hypothetical protein
MMEHNGFKANVMEAKRLTGEKVHALPPGSALPVHRVSEFKKHPTHWMEEDGCYVIPVKPDKGLWFDWTDNDMLNTAVVPTVKGCNPITGLKTDRLGLERYEKKCPKHKIKFKDERYCEKCGYKWPDQNYVTTPNTLWWDGFRSNDGNVRQFFITEDMMRDIANHMIGKENTVPAFGFAFFKPKEARIAPAILDYFTINNKHNCGCGCGHWGCGCGHWHCNHPQWVHYMDSPAFNGLSFSSTPGDPGNLKLSGGTSAKGISEEHIYLNNSVSGSYSSSESPSESVQVSNTNGMELYSQDKIPVLSPEEAEKKYASKGVLRSMSMAKKKQPVAKKEVAVGAGAKIEQGLIVDPYGLDSWKDEPDSIMRIYFVFQEELEHWKSFGLKDLDGKVHGMLDKLPVG